MSGSLSIVQEGVFYVFLVIFIFIYIKIALWDKFKISTFKAENLYSVNAIKEVLAIDRTFLIGLYFLALSLFITAITTFKDNENITIKNAMIWSCLLILLCSSYGFFALTKFVQRIIEIENKEIGKSQLIDPKTQGLGMEIKKNCTNSAGEPVGKRVAVIVVGDHYTGKSRTINTLKLKLDRFDKSMPHQKMTVKENYFMVDDGKDEGTYITGWIYSQSLQEKGWEELSSVSSKINDGGYDILVLASRHEDDPDGYFLRLTDVIDFLNRRGFKVYVTTIIEHKNDTDALYGISDTEYYQQKASEIYEYILQAKIS
jgi:hypothetical protein